MNNNQRINQLLLQTRGLSSTNLEGTALIEQLRKEAFALAAWSCREIDRITAERDEARRMWCEAAPVGNSLSVDDMARRARAEAADEIERLRAQLSEYDRHRVEYCSAWLQWIQDHDALDVMEWMAAYANAIPAPNPDGKSVAEIHAAIDARSRQAAMEIERLRTRVAELEARNG